MVRLFKTEKEEYYMDTNILKSIGLVENEIKIYLALLRTEPITAYELSKKTGIYRAHIYDKLERLMEKGLVTHVYQGAKRYFQATSPEKIKDYLEEKKLELENQEKEIDNILPDLKALQKLPKENTKVEVFKDKEGLKYFLRDIIKTKKEVLVTGIDDEKYQENLPHFMNQYFRDLRKNEIKERIITSKKPKVFLFDKKIAPTTSYRFLEEKQFNPTNTFVYGNKVVIISWGTPVTAVMIENNGVAETYRNYFEHLWSIASKENK